VPVCGMVNGLCLREGLLQQQRDLSQTCSFLCLLIAVC